MSRIRVVFPSPFGPMSPTLSPSDRVKEIFSSRGAPAKPKDIFSAEMSIFSFLPCLIRTFLRRMKGMKYQDKLERIRALEAELSFADPTRAAKLTRELVRLKAEVFRGS